MKKQQKNKKIILVGITHTGTATYFDVFNKNYSNCMFLYYDKNTNIDINQDTTNKLNVLGFHLPLGTINNYLGRKQYIIGDLAKDSIILSMLREPIIRTISQYYFIYAHYPFWNLFDKSTMKRLSLKEYIQSTFSWKNEYVRWFLDYKVNGEISKEDFLIAKKNMEMHFSLIGITEQFDEFLLLLKQMEVINNITYSKVGATYGRPSLEQLDDSIINYIKENNQYALELYELAKEKFKFIIKKQGGEFKNRLEEFKNQNAVNSTKNGYSFYLNQDIHVIIFGINGLEEQVILLLNCLNKISINMNRKIIVDCFYDLNENSRGEIFNYNTLKPDIKNIGTQKCVIVMEDKILEYLSNSNVEFPYCCKNDIIPKDYGVDFLLEKFSEIELDRMKTNEFNVAILGTSGNCNYFLKWVFYLKRTTQLKINISYIFGQDLYAQSKEEMKFFLNYMDHNLIKKVDKIIITSHIYKDIFFKQLEKIGIDKHKIISDVYGYKYLQNPELIPKFIYNRLCDKHLMNSKYWFILDFLEYDDLEKTCDQDIGLIIGVFGAGEGGRLFIDAIQSIRKELNLNINISKIFDNNSSKIGNELNGYQIVKPIKEEIDSVDKVVITSIYNDSIEKQLINLGVEKSKILKTQKHFLIQLNQKNEIF